MNFSFNNIHKFEPEGEEEKKGEKGEGVEVVGGGEEGEGEGEGISVDCVVLEENLIEEIGIFNFFLKSVYLYFFLANIINNQ